MLVPRKSLGYIWPWDPEWIWPWELLNPETIRRKQALLEVTTPKLTPAAPTTAAKMRSWTPEDITEAFAARREQYIESAGAGTNTVGLAPQPAQTFPWWLLVCAALAAGAIGIQLARR